MRRGWLLAGLLLLLTALAVWRWWPRPSPPNGTVASPWQNTHPGVGYTGDEACASCHIDIARTYAEHPMGRSLSPIRTATPIERFDAAARNPFEASSFRYQVERRGDSLLHRETALDRKGKSLAAMEVEVPFAVGSGQRGRAYLIDRDGYLFTSPITWYPQKGIWDLSPGYDRLNPHFSRPVVAACLFCHCNFADAVEHTVNRYRPPIFHGHAVGCERCHGPGELHVQRRESGEVVHGTDATIVNPRRLNHASREAVCQQCHLQGEERVLRRDRKPFDYRPGLPLEEYWRDFVKPAASRGDAKFVGTVEQMYASRCFQESPEDAKLGCISCHDPHALPPPEQKVAYYRKRCLECHARAGCSVPVAERLRQNKDDSCIACHMPATGSDVRHTAITDHRIPRRPLPPSPASFWPRPGQLPLVPFHGGDAADDEVRRDLGLALMELSDRQPDAAARDLAARALPLLEAAVARDPRDLPARHAHGEALWMLGRSEAALSAFTAVLVQAPEHEITLARATLLAGRMKRWEEAGGYAQRALQVNPWRWEHYHELGMIRAQSRDWPGAVAACQKALQLHPAGLLSRAQLVTCLIQMKDRPRAEAEFEVFLEFNPPEKQEALRRWFRQRMP